jgi:hypothetical protein
MDAVDTSETSANFYQTTHRNIPEDSYLHTRRRENLKSQHYETSYVRIQRSYSAISQGNMTQYSDVSETGPASAIVRLINQLNQLQSSKYK